MSNRAMLTETISVAMSDRVKLKLEIKETGGKSWVIVVHGLGENRQRHKYFYNLFPQGKNFCHYDHRGHGESEGERGSVNNFIQLVQDLNSIIQYLQRNYRVRNYTLFGHSMGGLIVADFLQNFATEENYPNKVFLSAPPVKGSGFLAQSLAYLPQVTKGLSSMPFGINLGGMIDLSGLSHDSRVYEDYVHDPLNLLRLNTKLLFGLIDRANYVFARPIRCRVPLACCVGDEDRIIDFKALEHYFKFIEKGARFKVIHGAYHEIHNEILKYRRQYFAFLTHFINENFD